MSNTPGFLDQDTAQMVAEMNSPEFRNHVREHCRVRHDLESRVNQTRNVAGDLAVQVTTDKDGNIVFLCGTARTAASLWKAADAVLAETPEAKGGYQTHIEADLGCITISDPTKAEAVFGAIQKGAENLATEVAAKVKARERVWINEEAPKAVYTEEGRLALAERANKVAAIKREIAQEESARAR